MRLALHFPPGFWSVALVLALVMVAATVFVWTELAITRERRTDQRTIDAHESARESLRAGRWL